MKFIILLFVLFFIMPAKGQNTYTKSNDFDEIIRFGEKRDDNKQLVHPDVHWIERETSIVSPNVRTTRYKFSEEETELDGKAYRELLFNYDELNEDFQGTSRYFREEEQKVFEHVQDREYLMYDFNPEEGQEITIENPNGPGGVPFEIVLDFYNPMELNTGEMRKVIGLKCPADDEPYDFWIEGIGSPLGFLDAPFTCYLDRNTQLRCFFRNDTLLYQDPSIGECWLPSITSEVTPPEIQIWPNPTGKYIQIETSVPFEKVTIYAPTGQQVGEYTFDFSNMSISNLANGLYFIQIEQNGKVIAVEKIVKIDP